ncbi:hypothetical protein EH165_12670 [Nakamurella antarctica]|uniref:Uncharacterized protein n=1 Tax=Nakamurella antarctica TaxID=1902245 RepID=A0A3G8ZPZ0_9ACTN|nr:hypothetical protein [Nakamurella antarctica]AZI58865.1 hypothetical protein EH165_12670 [Nakamurella antarctica]
MVGFTEPAGRGTRASAADPCFGAKVLMAAERALGDVFDSVIPLANQFRALVAGCSEPPASSDLAALRPAIFELLQRHDGVIGGAGVVVAPHVLRDHSHWLEWWWTGARGKPEALRVDSNPDSPDFYDYATTDWYATPIQTGNRRTSGPYVDYICTNEYALTLSVPVFVDGAPVGVAAADVLISSLERLVLPALLLIPQPTALASAGGRIIVSNSPHWLPADRLPAEALDHRLPTTGARTEQGRTGEMPWYLVDLGAAMPARGRRESAES